MTQAQFPPGTMLPGNEAFLQIGSVSHGGTITRSVLHEDNRVTHSFHVGGTDLEMHGIPAKHFSPLAE